ncbi:Sin3 binding region of histone deacetylase complex subunit SAP30-domain-containing protein [Zychaea mexicana]|uniref:Sin3 binding region of histone deacetylase complex subunit SAP30-domain-containing protein n=1 Tax=Zychaea mexicana TaxID=64656 RepID=UPI0022FE30F5|nr:Sin3 binding region of histone deacetylase complex subunit SAP30-domain-containing protein [Zychaea mexicana]KAI9494875.1 Sin3 binding region of histone deacetylase complex subunit SAP30-domain-containing protein [Zychaea mexicana]
MPAMKSKPRASAMNGTNNANTQPSVKHSSGNMDRERDKRRRTENNNVGKEFQTINFNSLDMPVLRKYARVHKIKVPSKCNKEELVAAVSRHFANQTVKEVDAITCFLYTARYRDSVLRLPLNIH